MEEITVKEMVERIGNEVVDVESIDVYGVGVNIHKASIDYEDTGIEILTFAYGDHINGGMSISYDVEGCIASVTYDEDDESYTIQFSEYMADINISVAQKLRLVK